MTEDEQEAESYRYSTRTMKILPLTSGRIAVLGPRNELFRIVDTWDEAKGLGPEIYGVFTPRKYVEEYNKTSSIKIDVEL